jgi:hypothetical protein
VAAGEQAAATAQSSTGQTVPPRSRSASISATRAATRRSTTANTSSTVRPDAAMRARIAAFTSRTAPFRSDGVVSQCGSAGSVSVVVIPTPSVRTPYWKRR